MMPSRTPPLVETPGFRKPAEGAMEPSRKRSGSGSLHNVQQVSLSELQSEGEVADILARFDFYRRHNIGWYAIIGEWGVRRHRSSANLTGNASEFATAKCEGSPKTPLSLSPSITNSDPPADPPCPARPAPCVSKSERTRKTPNRRRQKKLTPKEYKDMLNALSLERERLKQALEQMNEECRNLKDEYDHMKSELELKLGLRREEKAPSTPRPTSSHGDLAPETPVSLGPSPFPNGQQGSENLGAMLRSSSACDEPRSIQRSSDPCSPESPSGSENGDSLRPGEDAFCHSGVPDMNASGGALQDAIPNASEGQMHPSMNKAAAAANARRRRIELKRVRNTQFHKARLR